MPVQWTTESIDVALRAFACGDNSCSVASPKGMATNGGCQCPWGAAREISKEVAQRINKVLQLFRMKVRLLQEENARLRCELALLRKFAEKYVSSLTCDGVYEHPVNGCAAALHNRPCESCREYATWCALVSNTAKE